MEVVVKVIKLGVFYKWLYTTLEPGNSHIVLKTIVTCFAGRQELCYSHCAKSDAT